MARNNLPRRAVLSGIVAALLWSGSPAYALTKSSAKTLINQAVDDINAMIASTDDEEIILVEFEKIFELYFILKFFSVEFIGEKVLASIQIPAIPILGFIFSFLHEMKIRNSIKIFFKLNFI